jgi:hypothetical protein
MPGICNGDVELASAGIRRTTRSLHVRPPLLPPRAPGPRRDSIFSCSVGEAAMLPFLSIVALRFTFSHPVPR